MDLNLRGKWAVVCGASKGLGFAIANALANEGCNLLLCSREQSALNKAHEALNASGVEIKSIAVDISSLNGVRRFIDFCLLHCNAGPDIVVNNIGGPSPSQACNTSEAQWQSGFDQLFQSNRELSTAFLGTMTQKKFGRIINITSLSAIEPIESLVISNAMRAAVSAFAKTLVQEVAADGITVNSVMPGVIRTDRILDLRRSRAQRLGTDLEFEMKQTAALIPCQRLGEPAEFAALVCFLASPLASYINGANIPVDGGLRRSWS